MKNTYEIVKALPSGQRYLWAVFASKSEAEIGLLRGKGDPELYRIRPHDCAKWYRCCSEDEKEQHEHCLAEVKK